jgi:myxalamid-type polyketide synthase MxaE and MxaD
MSDTAASADAIEAWLIAKLAERLGIAANEIDIREPFASYGLGSTEAVSLAGELADWLGRKLSPALAYEYSTIEALARHLAGLPDTSEPAEGAGQRREANSEPIAIIGVGCRFPGASDPAAFWRLLRDGVDAIREVPADRFDQHAFYDADPTVPGKMNTRWGGFLTQVDQFDPHFFGISPREARRMDPQQRLLLEVTWEALQDAGQVPERLAGSQVGVFIGIATNDYGRLQWDELERIDAYAGTGNALSIAANRISYLFDFRGPSLAIDTACSSSLVAVHLACCSLRSGESTLALAGGANLILSPAIAINFTKAGAMAPDGRCKAFDARANGYVRSEGAGVVVLKRLSQALADGDPIHAVIRGSAVNQDGRSNGLMAPNPLAQEAVLREAYRQAEISPGDVDYVEAHGTGTLLGDPIEAKALGAVLGTDRPPDRPCALGSVKTNVGHLEAAAGVAGLIKVAQALRHRRIPPSLHFETPNPHIPFGELPLRVQTALGSWTEESGPALAGVSSFGFGGTNVHVVLQAAPAAAARTADAERQHGTQLLPLSARSPEALKCLASAYQEFLATPEPAVSLPDVCYTASARLGHHDHRLAVAGNSPAQLIDSLNAFLRGETRPGLSSGRKQAARRRKLVFVFSGQGSQWFGMGRRLLEREAVFRDAIERCDAAMRPYRDWSLLAELAATDAARSRLDEVDIVQPALFAVQIALAALWRSWGVEPNAVVGHSLGEVAAAYVAGALSLDDAVKVVCHRSRLFTRTVGQGAMAAVELSIEDASRALAGSEDLVSIAASNGPGSTVLSGDPAALGAILERLRRDDIFCRLVKVDFAAHSPQMEPLRADLLRALQGLQPRAGAVPICSTVTGQVRAGPDFDAPYWARNMREPVLFSAAVQRLAEDGHDIFLEISPHPILLSAMQQGLQRIAPEAAVLPSLRRDEDEHAVLLGSLGALYVAGYPIDWTLIHPAGGRCVPLPSYPWQRERCWLEPATASANQGRPHVVGRNAGDHPLLGAHAELPHPAGTHVWETTLDKTSLPYLDDHRIQGVAVLPASVYLEAALAAADEVFGAQFVALREVEFRKALFLPEGATRTLQVILAQGTDGATSFHIYSCAEPVEHAGTSSVLHATGKIRLQQDDSSIAPQAGRETLADIRRRCGERISGQDYYRGLRESGIDYGPLLRGIAQLWRSGGELLAELRVPDAAETEFHGWQVHPSLLDAGFQVFGAAIGADASGRDRQGIYLPTGIDEVRLQFRPPRQLWTHARVRRRDADSATADVRLLDEAGQVAVALLGLRFDHVGAQSHGAAFGRGDDWLYEFEWQPRDLAAATPAAPAGRASWLIFADNEGVGVALSALLRARGERSILVARGDSYEQTDDGHFRIRADRADDMRRLFAASLAADRPGCRGIVHLWSLDAAGPDETTVASLTEAETLGCASVLKLVQELARTEAPDPPLLWLMTRGAQAVGENGSVLSVAQSPLWGLGRVIAQEHPTFWGGLMDLQPGAASRDLEAQKVWEEIASASGEDQVAVRDGRRYVGRLVRQRPSATPAVPLRWRTDGTYLISGGLGDLGLLVARWMVGQGARRLILLGRTPLPPRSDWSAAGTGTRQSRRIAAVRDLESAGASVHLAPVDVADEAALTGFLAAFRAEGWPPIRGVVHAAGVLRDGLLVQLDAAALAAVLRPKVTGGWLLHSLLHDDPLDFFVLFSSAGAVLGQPGQGNYAAANAFLDALAHHRRARGQPALSIDWGAWEGEGFADSVGGQRLAARLALFGIGSIAPKHALDLLGRLLGQGATQVLAVPVDWRQYQAFYPAGGAAPLLSELSREAASVARPADRASERRDAILAAEPAERRPLLQSYLSEQVARALGLSPSRLDLQQPLSHLGLDSLMAVELKNRIALDLKVNVPVVKFLQGFSVEQAVTQVLEQLAAEAADPIMPLAPAVAPLDGRRDAERLLASLDQLSDEQVSSLLDDMLAEASDAAVPR